MSAGTATAHAYSVEARTGGGGTGEIRLKEASMTFDASAEQSGLPGPADLLTAAFAACIIKNVERFSAILPFRYEKASVTVTAERQDAPPRMTKIRYSLTVVTQEDPARIELLHRNIKRHGTIYNTLAQVCDVDGTVLVRRAA